MALSPSAFSLQSVNDLHSLLLDNGPLTIHLIGVAGSGMSGIASLLLALGHRVTGSDRVTSEEVERLCQLGLQFSMSHSTRDAAEADLVVYSSAIHVGNVTFDEAKRLGKKMARRAEVLAALMMGKKGIVVCGMHGKTTTSSLLAHVLKEAGLHPSHYVGAEIPILGSNAHWSRQGDYFVAEGDESDGTLVNYVPEQAIVLNIEPEHLDFYQSLEAIDAVYNCLVAQTKGPLFYWAEDPGAIRVCASHPKAIAVGKSEGCLYRYENLQQEHYASTFDVLVRNQRVGSVTLSIPGLHNVHNALLVIALALELGISFEAITSALKKFCGAKRRFELKYEGKELLVFDDYGHHPTEIAATLATARHLVKERGHGRLIVLFQPHRYSRTVAFKEEFGKVLLNADLVFVTDIYPASEEPLPGVTGASIVESSQAQGHSSIFYHPTVEGLRKEVGPLLKPGDIILSLGAGNIHEEGTRLVADLEQRDQLLSVMDSAGSIKLYEPLSRHTTLRVGGPAQFWVEPETEEGFVRLVKYCAEQKIPVMVMGRGSNLLVRDGGILGVVIHLARGCFANCEVKGTQIHAGAGVKLKQLSGIARQARLGGFEWMEGIPGNVGGALRMNAGAMGYETMAQLFSIRYVTREGEIKEWFPPFEGVYYRDVPFFKNNYAIAATFQGYPQAQEKIETALEQSWKHRRETQPIAASAGCTFKNPKLKTGSTIISAGRLIEELGLKNRTVGKARVSEIHGNFIVNDGGATAAQVLELIEEIKQVALRERGVMLETEVQIVGENLV